MPARARMRDEVGPQLGLQQEARTRTEMTRGIRAPRTEDRRAATPARRRRRTALAPVSRPVAVMCVSRIVASGYARLQSLDQRQRGARLADAIPRAPRATAARDGRARSARSARRWRAGIRARAGRATTGATAAAGSTRSPSACRARAAVPSAARSRRASASPAAAMTSPGVGTMPMPPRSRARALARATPARRGSVATKSEIVGTPSAAARCTRPVSTPQTRSARGEQRRPAWAGFDAAARALRRCLQQARRCAQLRRAAPRQHHGEPGGGEMLDQRAPVRLAATACPRGWSRAEGHA